MGVSGVLTASGGQRCSMSCNEEVSLARVTNCPGFPGTLLALVPEVLNPGNLPSPITLNANHHLKSSTNKGLEWRSSNAQPRTKAKGKKLMKMLRVYSVLIHLLEFPLQIIFLCQAMSTKGYYH